jgi:hypothetical protein
MQRSFQDSAVSTSRARPHCTGCIRSRVAEKVEYKLWVSRKMGGDQFLSMPQLIRGKLCAGYNCFAVTSDFSCKRLTLLCTSCCCVRWLLISQQGKGLRVELSSIVGAISRGIRLRGAKNSEFITAGAIGLVCVDGGDGRGVLGSAPSFLAGGQPPRLQQQSQRAPAVLQHFFRLQNSPPRSLIVNCIHLYGTAHSHRARSPPHSTAVTDLDQRIPPPQRPAAL